MAKAKKKAALKKSAEHYQPKGKRDLLIAMPAGKKPQEKKTEKMKS